jgi:hypothetical protein
MFYVADIYFLLLRLYVHDRIPYCTQLGLSWKWGDLVFNRGQTWPSNTHTVETKVSHRPWRTRRFTKRLIHFTFLKSVSLTSISLLFTEVACGFPYSRIPSDSSAKNVPFFILLSPLCRSALSSVGVLRCTGFLNLCYEKGGASGMEGHWFNCLNSKHQNVWRAVN